MVKSTMKFCKECEAMLYAREEGGKMIYYCHACGHSEESTDWVVYYQNYGHTIPYTNPYHVKDVIHDMTMSRTEKYTCPNESCPTEKGGAGKEAIFWRDSSDLTMHMICTQCHTSWQN